MLRRFHILRMTKWPTRYAHKCGFHLCKQGIEVFQLVSNVKAFSLQNKTYAENQVQEVNLSADMYIPKACLTHETLKIKTYPENQIKSFTVIYHLLGVKTLLICLDVKKNESINAKKNAAPYVILCWSGSDGIFKHKNVSLHTWLLSKWP